MRIDKITRHRREFAVSPMDELKRSWTADVKVNDAAKRRLESVEVEMIPQELSERRVAGKSPVKVWREHRGLTQANDQAVPRLSRPEERCAP